MKEISIKEIENIRIGNAQDEAGGTGCTVIICEKGMPAGLDVRGGGPAARESELLKPTAGAQAIHALLFGGGSAFGLDAAGGVMRYLEERGIGYETGFAKVPLVCQSDIYDLGAGDPQVRPDREMGYAACVASEADNYRDGNFGVGTGATAGKFFGAEYCMKTGVGSYAVSIGELKLGALVVVNCFGDVFDVSTGKQIAGLLSEDRRSLRSTCELMYGDTKVVENKFTGNTTLGAVVTNAHMDKTQLTRVAALAQNGMARAIRPVHTSADGDSIYALSCGEVTADPDLIGTLAADVVSEAIRRAVLSATGAYGYPAACDLV